VRGKRRVSVDGGTLPRWRRDAKQLFYTTLDHQLMAAWMEAKSGALEVGKIDALFGGLVDYDVSGDGQRFLAAVPLEGQSQEPLTVVLNWTAGLKK